MHHTITGFLLEGKSGIVGVVPENSVIVGLIGRIRAERLLTSFEVSDRSQ